MNEIRIQANKIRELYLFTLAQLGVEIRKIEVAADAAVFASLRGIDSHGFIPELTRAVKEIKGGIVRPNADVKILKNYATGALVDANMGLGAVSGWQTMELALKKAQCEAVSIIVARNCNHFGAASYYAARALEKNMIGVIFCNSTPTTATFGGREPVHGTNPMSFAIPAGEYDPLILDIATSVVSGGKISEALKKGEKIPIGWALDKHGHPTTDPKAALEGVRLPMAGHKGYGLGLVVDVFTAALAGSLIAKEISPHWDLNTPYSASYFTMAINVKSFAGIGRFKDRVDRLIRDCKSSTPMEGCGEVLVPGEIEFKELRKRKKEGIPVAKKQWRDMIENLKSNGVKPETWESLDRVR